jgi:hypothetical protein
VARWIVSGIRKVRGNLVPIADSVHGGATTAEAMAKARKRYPDAPELSVSREPRRSS